REKRSSSPPTSEVVILKPDGAGPPFFCVHPVFGEVFCYAELARALGPNRPFYAIRARGLEADEAPRECFEDMAEAYLDGIRRFQPRGPYVIGGWSDGGIIAVDIAR